MATYELTAHQYPANIQFFIYELDENGERTENYTWLHYSTDGLEYVEDNYEEEVEFYYTSIVDELMSALDRANLPLPSREELLEQVKNVTPKLHYVGEAVEE
jgi:hypothetical protein|nr:MAG TPA: hypothetical protein [Caudoviricetes sp.]